MNMAEMMAVIESQALNWKLEHPQLVEGTLYLTPDQYQELGALVIEDRSGQPPSMASIPVVVIEPHEQITLPSGKILVYSKVMESFYVMTKPPTFEYEAPAADVARLTLKRIDA